MSESFESITDLLSTAAPDSFSIATHLYGPCLQAAIAWTPTATHPKSVHKTRFVLF